jgi:hypothetical protein
LTTSSDSTNNNTYAIDLNSETSEACGSIERYIQPGTPPASARSDQVRKAWGDSVETRPAGSGTT